MTRFLDFPFTDILLKRKLSVSKHDLRERWPSVNPSDPPCWASL